MGFHGRQNLICRAKVVSKGVHGVFDLLSYHFKPQLHGISLQHDSLTAIGLPHSPNVTSVFPGYIMSHKGM